MEFLNSIWIALTTENPGLVKILLILCGFIEAYLGMMLFINVLNIKTSKHESFSVIYVYK